MFFDGFFSSSPVGVRCSRSTMRTASSCAVDGRPPFSGSMLVFTPIIDSPAWEFVVVVPCSDEERLAQFHQNFPKSASAKIVLKFLNESTSILQKNTKRFCIIQVLEANYSILHWSFFDSTAIFVDKQLIMRCKIASKMHQSYLVVISAPALC